MEKVNTKLTLFVLFFFISQYALSSGQCNIKVQLTNFSPSVCYLDSSQTNCIDLCQASIPQGTPSCFNELKFPCALINELYVVSPGFQSVDGENWVHINDVLNFPDLRSELFILRDDLYEALFSDYITPPSINGFSVANQQVKKDNFRLALIEELRDLLDPLKNSAVYKRLTFGLALDEGINNEFDSIVNRVFNFPLFDLDEKNSLNEELINIKNNELFLWDFLSVANPDLIASSRVTYLNGQLEKLSTLINNLDDDKKAFILNKLTNNLLFSSIGVTTCSTGVCFNEIVSGPDFFLGMDQSLTYFEDHLNMAIAEAEALDRSIGSDLVLQPAADFSYPNFSGLTMPYINNYVSNPSANNLMQLEVAINVAYLQQGSNGLDVLSELKEHADKEIIGHSYLAPLEDKRTLLCKEFNHLDSDLKSIQDEVFLLVNESRDIFSLIREEGHTPERVARLQDILTRINFLNEDAQRITNLDRFKRDRSVGILWNFDDITNSFDTELYTVQLEYIAFDGLHWIPSIALPLQYLIPSITELSTVKGSLLPSGNGKMTASNSLRLTLSQSAYTGCVNSNKDINLVVSVIGKNGQSKRYVLRATLDQF